MSKLLQISLFIFLTGIGRTAFTQNAITIDKSPKVDVKQINIPPIKEKQKMNLDEHTKAKNSYLNSSIHSITARKDALLNAHGTFKAARKAGALVPHVKTTQTNNIPNKK